MAACEACSARCNLGTNSVFALGMRKTTENLDRIGRSQDLPDANCLLAGSSAFNAQILTLVVCFENVRRGSPKREHNQKADETVITRLQR
jgi:hypothetical protein